MEKALCCMYICIAILIGGTAAYLKMTWDDKENNVLAAEDTTPKSGQVVNVDSNLCIRKEPDINSDITYMLYDGMTFDILEDEGDWYYIQYDDRTGYVNKDYVEEYDGQPPNPTYEENEEQIIKEKMGGELKEINVELTAYCNCKICSDNWGSETAMQTQTRIGVVAAPKEIALGSRLYIPELNDYKDDCIFDVEDRGGAVKQKDDGTYIIDVWLPTHEEVKEFGRKKAVAYIVKN